MRLTCPSCGAQYEVPPEAIPPAGREVQCSACQQSWFERGTAPPPRLVEPEPWDEIPRVEDGEEEADDLAEARVAPPPPPVPMRPRVDPEVSRILREEAEREARARAEEGRGLDVPEIHRPTLAPPRRLRPREVTEPVPAPVPAAPAPPEAASAAAPRTSARPARIVDGELDLDQINSTLRSQADHRDAKVPRIEPAAPARSGFGRGFWGAMLLLALLAGLYVLREPIVGAVPAASAILDPYARAVDEARDWLNVQVGRLLGADPPPAE